MRRVPVVVAALLGVLAISPIAQQQPQFKGGTDLVAIDFTALGPDGRAVSDLTAREITVKVDGRTRDIKNLQFVRLAQPGGTAVVAPGAAVLPPPFAANDRSAPARNVLIVMDQDQIGAGEGKTTVDAAARFLDRLAPIDRVGLVTMPAGGIQVDLTTNHARVRAALSTLVGKSTRRSPFANISLDEVMIILDERMDPDKQRTNEILDRECRWAQTGSPCRQNVIDEARQIARETERATRATLQSLTGLFEGLATIEGPKTVVFLSQALVRFEDTHLDMEDVARAASKGRVQLYVLQLHKPGPDVLTRNTPPERTNDGERTLGGLGDLASSTGGELLRVTGLGDTVFSQIADQMSAYYLLGFEPRAEERDGKTHRIQVTTTRRGVTIKTRPMFVIDDPDRLGPKPTLPVTVLRDRAEYRELPLRAAAYAFRDPDPKHVRIVVALETGDASTALTSAAFALVDVKGQRAAEWTEEGENVVRRPLLTAAAVPPGEYLLRVTAIDTAGRLGAVEQDIVATLTPATPFTFGPLMLGWNEAGAFRPRLLFDAAAQELAAYLELYGSPPAGTPFGVVFEIAATADGPAIVSAGAQLFASSDPDRRVASGTLAISGLAPGDYVVRALATVNGATVGRTLRTLRKAAR